MKLSKRSTWTAGILIVLISAASIWNAIVDRRSPGEGLPRPLRSIAIEHMGDDPVTHLGGLAAPPHATELRLCREGALRALGLVSKSASPVDSSLLARISGLFGGVPVGRTFYRVGTDTIYVFEPAEPEQIRHEWVHALEDQRVNLAALQRAASTTDEEIALRASVEGTARTLAGEPVGAPAFGTDLRANALVLAYAVAPRTLQRARLTPEQSLRRVFRTTLEAVSGLSVDPGPLPAPAPDAACSDRLGFVGVFTAMLAAGADEKQAAFVGGSWRNDRVEVLPSPAGARVRWTVAFRSVLAEAVWREVVGKHEGLTTGATELPSLVD